MGQITTGMIETLVKQIKAANRKRSEAAARREVQQALDELRACRAYQDAGAPLGASCGPTRR
jgi:type II secretory pathway pseudopilin PulG